MADGTTIYLVEPDQATDLIHKTANTVIHQLADVLRPFYRDGRHIPDLLQPREHVTVDPAIRGGVPVIEGTRIPYDEVAALLRDQKNANSAHAKLRGPGERANAQLKSWRILRKLRCCPLRAGQLVKAIRVLQLREAG